MLNLYEVAHDIEKPHMLSSKILVLFLLGSLILHFNVLQSFFAGLAASGVLASGLRLVTKAGFESSKNGLRKGTSMLLLFTNGHRHRSVLHTCFPLWQFYTAW